MSLLPILALLFIPILFGVNHLFEWLDPAHIEHDVLIQKKLPYLNLPFFIIRNIIYFVSWTVISGYYWKQSIAQDTATTQEAQENITKDLQRKSPVAFSSWLYSSLRRHLIG